MHKKIKTAFFCFAVVCCLAAPLNAKDATTVFENVSSSIVVIETYNEKGETKGLGSGVVISTGVVATNHHVIDAADKITVKHKGKEYAAAVLHDDKDRDVCTLTVAGLAAPAIVFGSTGALKTGARVYAVGAPQGLDLSLSDGIISSLREVDKGQFLLQITAPISPGSSGGGLFDEEGRLIGLPTFYLAEAQQLNFAIPVEWIRELPDRPKEAKTSSTTYEKTEWLFKAIALEEKGDFVGLRDHALKWTKAQALNYMAWLSLGVAYDKLGQYAKAIEALRQGLRVEPDYPGAWMELGRAYDKSDQSAKAIEAYQQALRINSDDAEAWGWLGKAYQKIDQTTKSIEAYQQAVRINPDWSEAWVELSEAYRGSGQIYKATEALQQAVRINPGAEDLWFLLGYRYFESGQFAKAIEACQQAIRIKEDYAEAYWLLGDSYTSFDLYQEAMEAFKKAIRIDPSSADYYSGLGKAYLQLKRFQEAVDSFKQAIRIEPGSAQFHFNLGA